MNKPAWLARLLNWGGSGGWLADSDQEYARIDTELDEADKWDRALKEANLHQYRDADRLTDSERRQLTQYELKWQKLLDRTEGDRNDNQRS